MAARRDASKIRSATDSTIQEDAIGRAGPGSLLALAATFAFRAEVIIRLFHATELALVDKLHIDYMVGSKVIILFPFLSFRA